MRDFLKILAVSLPVSMLAVTILFLILESLR